MDGKSGLLYLVQARPETVQARRTPALRLYSLRSPGEVLTSGIAVGDQIARGTLRLLRNPGDFGRLHEGEVLVTATTDPDWEPVMKRAAAIVTDHGGRTSHAAIVARELYDAAKGRGFASLDAPVSGGQAGAARDLALHKSRQSCLHALLLVIGNGVAGRSGHRQHVGGERIAALLHRCEIFHKPVAVEVGRQGRHGRLPQLGVAQRHRTRPARHRSTAAA